MVGGRLGLSQLHSVGTRVIKRFRIFQPLLRPFTLPVRAYWIKIALRVSPLTRLHGIIHTPATLSLVLDVLDVLDLLLLGLDIERRQRDGRRRRRRRRRLRGGGQRVERRPPRAARAARWRRPHALGARRRWRQSRCRGVDGPAVAPSAHASAATAGAKSVYFRMKKRHTRRAGTHHTAAVKNRHQRKVPACKGLGRAWAACWAVTNSRYG